MRMMFPDRHDWSRTNMLLADIADTLRWLQWAKTKDGHRNRNTPKRIPRPGVGQPARPGLKPKAAPLSVIKQQFAIGDDPDRADRLKKLFDGR